MNNLSSKQYLKHLLSLRREWINKELKRFEQALQEADKHLIPEDVKEAYEATIEILNITLKHIDEAEEWLNKQSNQKLDEKLNKLIHRLKQLHG